MTFEVVTTEVGITYSSKDLPERQALLDQRHNSQGNFRRI